MKKTALVTGGTAKDVPAIAALILNIKQINYKFTDDIIVFHDGISESDQIIIKKILPVKFRYYKYPGNTDDFPDGLKNYFSTMIFCKYECFNLLNEYKTVIWTDYDVILNNDISELLIPIPFGFRMMLDTIHKDIRTMFTNEINNISVKNNLDVPAICTPIFVFFDNMIKYNEYYNYCLEKTDKFAPYLYLPEQCIFNLLIQDYNIQYENIDYQTYCANPLHVNITESTKIIHAYGQPKFWNGLNNSVWENNYKTWLKMGGSVYYHKKLFYIIKKYLKEISKKFLKSILPENIYQLLKSIILRKNINNIL